MAALAEQAVTYGRGSRLHRRFGARRPFGAHYGKYHSPEQQRADHQGRDTQFARRTAMPDITREHHRHDYQNRTGSDVNEYLHHRQEGSIKSYVQYRDGKK